MVLPYTLRATAILMPMTNLLICLGIFLYKWNHAACSFWYLDSFDPVCEESSVLFRVAIVHISYLLLIF